MTISSTLTPDIDDICRTHLGRGVRAAARIGTGRNSRVFKVDLQSGEANGSSPTSVVVKFYRRDPGDGRNRLAVEFGGLQFLWDNGQRAIARPIAADRDRHCGIYEHIAGAPFESLPSAGDVDQAVAFLASLKPMRAGAAAARQPVASEAEFSIARIAASITGRIERLRDSACNGDGAELRRWITDTLEPLLRDVSAWCRQQADRQRIAFDGEIAINQRILSPSDFGFHNAIRRPDGTVAFVDFEYFGWDDPAKTAADFVLHPGMTLDDSLRRRFVQRFVTAFDDIEQLAARVRIVYPLFGLKWCVILLNDFLSGRESVVAADEMSAVRRRQLAKADDMATRIAGAYRSNPYCL